MFLCNVHSKSTERRILCLKKEKKNKSFESSQQKKPHKKKSFDKKNEVKLNLSSDKRQSFSFHLVFGQK